MILLKEDQQPVNDSIKIDSDLPTLQKDDNDSGLDNSSDCGHSCDEENSSGTSDSDDILNCDNDTDLVKNENQNETVKCPHLNSIPSTENAPKCPFKSQDHNLSTVVMINDSNNNDNDLSKKCSEDIGWELEYLQLIEESTKVPTDFSITPDDVPEWLDMEKFKRGQKFALDHLFGINYANMLSLFLIFAVKPAPGTLIYTNKSDTPFKAFKRYLSTGIRIKSWYEGDVWSKDPNSPARRSLETVSRMHKNVYMKLKDLTYDDVKDEMTFEKDGVDRSKFPTKDIIQEDLKETCPMHPYFLQVQQKYKTKEHLWFSQTELIFTQFAFVGLAIRYPERFGIFTATKEDFEGFIHFWRGIGYLMGMKDKFNFCNGDLEQVRKQTDEFIRLSVKPNLKVVDVDWERMCRSVVDGLGFYIKGMSFEASLLYLCDILDISVPKLKNSLNFMQYVTYLSLKFMYSCILRIPGASKYFRDRVQERINEAVNASPETLAKWEAKKFSYID